MEVGEAEVALLTPSKSVQCHESSSLFDLQFLHVLKDGVTSRSWRDSGIDEGDNQNLQEIPRCTSRDGPAGSESPTCGSSDEGPRLARQSNRIFTKESEWKRAVGHSKVLMALNTDCKGRNARTRS